MHVPVNEPLLDGNEIEYLSTCVKTGWISSEGEFVNRLENDFARTVQKKFGIAVASGTAALDIAVKALNIGPGDDVIMPAFTIISCAAAIVKSGATPILVDSDPQTWNMDVIQVEDKITERTKAIMVVHIYGLPVDVDPVLKLAEKYNLPVIEDAAQAIGLHYKDRPCGSLGTISTFSFYPNKLVTTGEGGLIAVDDYSLADRCKALRNLCFGRENRFEHEELGWNYRMSNLQAALGVAQLEKLQVHLQRKSEIARFYRQAFSKLRNAQLPLQNTSYANNCYWVFGMVLTAASALDNKSASSRLKERGVGTRPFFWPMHKQPVFLRMGLFRGECYPVAEWLSKKGFYIPSGLGIQQAQLEHVVEVVLDEIG